jgi:hypothetical protein
MCATRLGDADTALAALLHDSPKNSYLVNGHNSQVPNRLPVYLPGNGALLNAVALMTAGWEGCERELPGFPTDGSWTVRYEGFEPRP